MSKARPYSINIDTRAGIKNIKINKDDTYSVDMGMPILKHSDFPASPIELENVLFSFVSMGNPHAVGIVSDLDKYNISVIGPKIENDKNFPHKINMELVEKMVRFPPGTEIPPELFEAVAKILAFIYKLEKR